jgi:hypothetical protein
VHPGQARVELGAEEFFGRRQGRWLLAQQARDPFLDLRGPDAAFHVSRQHRHSNTAV